VQTLDTNSTAILAGLAPGLFSVAILTINNLRDIDGDRTAGKQTLAVRLGAGFAKSEYVASIVLASLIPVGLWLMDGKHITSVAAIIVPVAAIPAFRKTLFGAGGRELNDVLATTGQLLALYAILFSVGWLV
jgi:1,4-dihydroxy-2-naphthoate octaprenyltransferase